MGAYDCDCINNLEYDRRERKRKEQSQSTAGQLNDSARSTAQSTNLIDRQAAIRWVKTECNPYGKPTLDFESGKKVIEHLEQMPPTQSEPKEGHWIPHESPDGGEQYECSLCGVLWEFTEGTPEDNEAYFCPKCGADMRGEKDG